MYDTWAENRKAWCCGAGASFFWLELEQEPNYDTSTVSFRLSLPLFLFPSVSAFVFPIVSPILWLTKLSTAYMYTVCTVYRPSWTHPGSKVCPRSGCTDKMELTTLSRVRDPTSFQIHYKIKIFQLNIAFENEKFNKNREGFGNLIGNELTLGITHNT